MPRKSESIKLPEKFDRRVKLTEEKKDEVRAKYATGFYSLNALAREYGVSKKLILITVNPESKRKNDEHIKNHWKDYYDRQAHTDAMREHRKYKEDLYVAGKIKLESE